MRNFGSWLHREIGSRCVEQGGNDDHCDFNHLPRVSDGSLAAHRIGRAAHRQEVPKWKGTVIDEPPLRNFAVNTDGDQEISPTNLW